jgi:putative FmdB family regulatory protein
VPIYDYICAACGHEMEVMHSVHGEGPAACPNCGARMRKAIAPLAVHFKGTGWARKDRASGRPSKPAPKETDSNGPGDSSAGSDVKSGASAGSGGETAPKETD